MQTKFVQRDGQNRVIGVFACLQPGIAEEELPHDHPAVLAYENPPPDPRRVADEEEAAADKLDAQLVATLDMTDAQINTAINNAFTDPAQRVIIKRLARLAQHAARGKVLR